MAGGVVKSVQVAGLSGIPANARTVLANVTLLSASATSAATLWAQGTAQPSIRYVQAVVGQTAACSGIFQLGSTGKLNVVHTAGTAHVLVDVYGYFDAAGTAWYVPAVPQRLLDTRSTSPRPVRGAVRAVPFNVPTGAVASLVNITAVKPAGPGYLSATASSSDPIATSVVNFRTGETRPNAGVVPLANKTTHIRVGTDAVDVLVDWYGTFVNAS